jgi:hypothetical protein
MTDSPLIWDIGDPIVFEIFVADPNTGLSLTGQAGFITLTIQRDYDSKYWSGSAWVTPLTNLTVTEVSAVDYPGRYKYTLNGSTGNNLATRYVAHANVDNPPTIENIDNYEVHVSRLTDVRVYESEPA